MSPLCVPGLSGCLLLSLPPSRTLSLSLTTNLCVGFKCFIKFNLIKKISVNEWEIFDKTSKLYHCSTEAINMIICNKIYYSSFINLSIDRLLWFFPKTMTCFMRVSPISSSKFQRKSLYHLWNIFQYIVKIHYSFINRQASEKILVLVCLPWQGLKYFWRAIDLSRSQECSEK